MRCVNQLGSDTDDDRDIRVNLSEGKVKLVRDNWVQTQPTLFELAGDSNRPGLS